MNSTNLPAGTPALAKASEVLRRQTERLRKASRDEEFDDSFWAGTRAALEVLNRRQPRGTAAAARNRLRNAERYYRAGLRGPMRFEAALLQACLRR
jgi:hypothetical protein